MIYIDEPEPNLLVSKMKHFGDDTRPADVVTFDPQKHTDRTHKLQQYITTLKERDTHRLLENYTDIVFNDFQAVTVLEREGEVVGFSTIFHRKNFYPVGAARILNRFYQDKITARIGFTREILRPTTYHTIMQQTMMATRLGYTHAFISREMRASSFFKAFIKELDRRTANHWELKLGPFLAAPWPAIASNWQSIAVTNLTLIKMSARQDFWNHWKTQ